MLCGQFRRRTDDMRTSLPSTAPAAVKDSDRHTPRAIRAIALKRVTEDEKPSACMTRKPSPTKRILPLPSCGRSTPKLMLCVPSSGAVKRRPALPISTTRLLLPASELKLSFPELLMERFSR